MIEERVTLVWVARVVQAETLRRMAAATAPTTERTTK